jgi:hypothetical protein
MLALRNMRPGEKVVKVIKVHWISYAILWTQIILVFIMDIIFHLFMGMTAITFFITILLWSTFLVFIYIQWINHELDLLIITNNRIIWIEQISFLNRRISETNLYQVQEVNSKMKWFLENLFNYWTIAIQTAWNRTTISMDMCSNAIQEARIILNIVESYKWSNSSTT